jgi:hypothetical protein
VTYPPPFEQPAAPAAPAPASGGPAPVLERPRRRKPVFGWIAFGLLLAALAVVAGATYYGYEQTKDAFIPGPPWFTVTASIATVPLAVLAFLGLVLGIVGVSRRERPGWPAVLAMVLAFPALGAAVFAAYVVAVVTISCAGPPGACG